MALELYDKYRDEDGYIDLNLAEKDGLFDPSSLRNEIRGSDRGVGLLGEDRNNALKGWFDFHTADKENTETFLIRTNMFRGEEKNYGDYAELFFEEIAKSVGIRTAHYDLFKYNGEKGVLSQKLIEKNETMISLADTLSSLHQEGVTLDFIDKLLTEYFLTQGKSAKEIHTVKASLRKITILDVSALNEDRHLGNICLINNEETGELSLAIYDNEITFLLANPINTFTERTQIDTYAELSTSVISAHPTASPIETVDSIMSDPDFKLLDFLALVNNVNINEITKKIEERIHAPIPVRVQNIVKLARKYRKKELQNIHSKQEQKLKKQNEARLLAMLFGNPKGGEDR